MTKDTLSMAGGANGTTRQPVPTYLIVVSVYVFLASIPLAFLLIGIPIIVFQILALRRIRWAAKTNSVILIVLSVLSIFGVFSNLAQGRLFSYWVHIPMILSILPNIVAGRYLKRWANTIDGSPEVLSIGALLDERDHGK